ncbi:MAG TPA: mechanosensitive ion channel domain-containing protein, partial [Armatimonadota bacterium]|nr:mechanosensitive ion channel domain-containing protein [Armatimonadota bacterium]
RVTTLVLLIGSVLKYVIIFFAGMMILQRVGLDPTPILAGAGVVGLAVGFGAQNLVRDVVSGFFIIMEGQYAVGDLVEINGVLGRVEEVGLRATKLRDPNGQLRYFSNGGISTANNYTEDYVAYVVNIPLQPQAPADPAGFAEGVFKDFEREFRVFVERPSVGSVETLPTYSRVLRVRVNAIPGRHTIVEQKLPARVAAALDRAGHALPAGTEVTCSLLFPAPGGRG